MLHRLINRAGCFVDEMLFGEDHPEVERVIGWVLIGIVLYVAVQFLRWAAQ
jgi:hypothetical protein